MAGPSRGVCLGYRSSAIPGRSLRVNRLSAIPARHLPAGKPPAFYTPPNATPRTGPMSAADREPHGGRLFRAGIAK
jgi:hypothetical protein